MYVCMYMLRLCVFQHAILIDVLSIVYKRQASKLVYMYILVHKKRYNQFRVFSNHLMIYTIQKF